MPFKKLLNVKVRCREWNLYPQLDIGRVALTISPPHSMLSVPYRCQDYYNKIDDILRQICKSYIMYPEFADDGRLHFHGVCRGWDKIKYHKWQYKLYKLLGQYKVTNMNNPLEWVLYCQKEWRHTSTVFSHCGVEQLHPLEKKNKRKPKEIRDIIPKEIHESNIMTWFETHGNTLKVKYSDY